MRKKLFISWQPALNINIKLHLKEKKEIFFFQSIFTISSTRILPSVLVSEIQLLRIINQTLYLKRHFFFKPNPKKSQLHDFIIVKVKVFPSFSKKNRIIDSFVEAKVNISSIGSRITMEMHAWIWKKPQVRPELRRKYRKLQLRVAFLSLSLSRSFRSFDWIDSIELSNSTGN